MCYYGNSILCRMSRLDARWGSMEAMVSQFLEKETAVQVILSSDRKTSHFVPTWQDIEVLEGLTKALSPLADSTDFLSGEKMATISSVVPVLHNIAHKVVNEQDDDTTKTKNIKSKIVDSLNVRSKVKELLEISTFRFKTDYC